MPPARFASFWTHPKLIIRLTNRGACRAKASQTGSQPML